MTPPVTTPASPVCSTCDDTHQVGSTMCSRCPIPCQLCRKDRIGAYCGETPCHCGCHRKDRAQERFARDVTTPASIDIDEAPLRMEAYYYAFDLTAVRAIDLVLSAVAVAGKLSHHTDGWSEHLGAGWRPAFMRGDSPVDWIQNAAIDAAAAHRTAIAEIERLRGELAVSQAEASRNYTISVRLTKERDDARSGWEAAKASCDREVRVRHDGERQLHASLDAATKRIAELEAELARVVPVVDRAVTWGPLANPFLSGSAERDRAEFHLRAAVEFYVAQHTLSPPDGEGGEG